MDDIESKSDRWDEARENAESTFKRIYLSKVLKANYPPKAYVKLEGRIFMRMFMLQDTVVLTDMHIAKNNCPELTEQTANAIDDASLHELFISTQRNNLYLCVKAALQ